MQFLAQYGLFVAKTMTFVIASLILLAGIVAIISKGKSKHKEQLEIINLNERFDAIRDVLNETMLPKKDYKKFIQEQKKLKKAQAQAEVKRKRIFVIDFDGDIKASAVYSLREEITGILTIATPHDEVVLRLESPGGMVPHYGLAASQLQRLKEKNIRLTVLIDKVAASGGYLMACVADRILAAPFAIIGSIGVVVEIPNFHRFLKKHDIDFELLTAGEHKRTVTLFGENTEQGRQKFREELTAVHQQFKDFILSHRSHVNLPEVATGEHWLARNALALNLIDDLMTSDDYLLAASNDADIYQLSYLKKKSLGEKLSGAFGSLVNTFSRGFVG